MSLANRVFSAGFWHSAAHAVARILALVRMAVLARLLSHDEFGLMAMVVLVVSSLWAVSDAGVEAAVVRKREPEPVWLHTAWQMNWMRGMLLGLVCWSAAVPVAAFFDRPELAHLLQWAALVPLLHGFASLSGPLLQKELDFRRRALIDLGKEAGNTVIAITLALLWRPDVWALLWGLAGGTAVATLVSYGLHAYRPRWLFDAPSAREIWHFGAHLMGAGILIFMITNLDNAVVGKLLDMDRLGQYSMAFMLAGIITSQLVQLLNSVMFPAMSHVQEDTARMQRILGYTLRLVAGFLTPITLLVALVPELPVRLALGEHWLMVAPAFLILTAMGWMRGLATVFGPSLLALGHSNLIHRIKWMEFALFAICIVPAVMHYGIEGAAMTLLLVYALSLVLHARAVGSLLGGIGLAVKEGGKGIVPAVAAFAVAGGWSLATQSTSYGEWVITGIFVVTWGMVFFFRERAFLLTLWAMRRA